MVLFLFVIMLLGAERLPGGEPLRWQRPAGDRRWSDPVWQMAFTCIAPAEWRSTGLLDAASRELRQPPADIGKILFTQYALPFEVTSVILLVAVIGAIVLTRIRTAVERPLARCPSTKQMSKEGNETMVPVEYYLALSAILFSLGIVGVLLRRNAIVIFMSLELMFNAANLAFVTFARYVSDPQRPDVRLLRDDRGRGGGGGRPGVDGGNFPHQARIDVDQMNSLKG